MTSTRYLGPAVFVAGHSAETCARTPLDTAVGVLVGRRRCSQRAAFGEIVEASKQSGIGLYALSAALVNLASGVDDSFAHRVEVEARWGGLLGLDAPLPAER